MKALVIIPAYNEEDSIASVVSEIIDAGFDYIVINDGSSDNTRAICEMHGFNTINLPQNLGIGGAIQTGHKYSREHGYDVNIQFDGDGQHDASSIRDLLDEIDNGCDLVVGSRFLEGSDGFQSTPLRRIGIIWLSFFIKLFTGAKVTDPTSGFRATGKKAIELFCDNYPIDYPEPESIVLALRSGLQVHEIPAVMYTRKGGVSSIGGISSIYYMVKVSLAIAILSFSHKKRG